MFITHATTTEEVLRQTNAVLSQGRADMVQLRMKSAPKSLLLTTAREIQVLCRNYGVPLIINDNVEAWVRRFPEQYLFAYNRYRNPTGLPRPGES